MTASTSPRPTNPPGLSSTAVPAPAIDAPPSSRTSPLAAVIATLVILALIAGIFRLGQEPGPGAQLQLSLLLGALFGVVVQRSRFCFQCIWRDWLDRRDPAGLLAIIAALAVGVAGYTLVFGAWLPDPTGTRLPPTAHIGPVGPALLVAGLAFGAGMALSGSCISAHLYRLGEGSPTSPFALAGAVAGFILGLMSWNSIYLGAIHDAPVLWLPRHLGYGGALLVTLALLGALAFWLLRWRKPAVAASEPTSPWRVVFVDRWPAWLGGVLVGIIGVAAYFRISPLGVTAEIGSRSRQLATAFDWLPSRIEGLDGFRGCATVVRDALLTNNGLFILGVVAASFACALLAGAFRPAWPSLSQVVRGFIGGALMGWGALIGLGCTVGTLLSGVSAGAVSGWVFGITLLIGATAMLWIGRKTRILS